MMGPLLLLLACVGFIVVSSARWKLHPFLGLLFAAFAFGMFSGMPLADVVKSVNEGFGGTMGAIGIVIVCGTIIGVFLEKSGGAFTLADSVLRLTGRRNVPLAMALVGYIVSIPVFCDSGFVILISLAKALAKKGGLTLTASAVALALGLYATHTMVPPTPGPMAAAGILGADLGLVILFGLLVGAAAAFVSWIYAVAWAGREYVDPEPEITLEEMESQLQQAPPAFKAFLPLLVPIVLILLNSIAAFPSHPFGDGWVKQAVQFIGHPVVALMLGVLLAFRLPPRLHADMLSTTGWVGEGLLNSAAILLITGAGGSFGKVLQNSGITQNLGESLAQFPLGIWLPFLIAAAIKTAQGSSTVAIITTATIVSSLTSSLGIVTPSQTALAVVMIGAGSMVLSHVNDSYFWVVTQFSRLSVVQGYRLFTLGSVLEGFTAGVATWILYRLVS